MELWAGRDYSRHLHGCYQDLSVSQRQAGTYCLQRQHTERSFNAKIESQKWQTSSFWVKMQRIWRGKWWDTSILTALVTMECERNTVTDWVAELVCSWHIKCSGVKGTLWSCWLWYSSSSGLAGNGGGVTHGFSHRLCQRIAINNSVW